MRAAWGPSLTPGIGRNTNAPATRDSTRRNPYNVESESVTLTGITSQIAQNGNGIRHDSLEHPRHEQNQAQQKGNQPGNGVEGRVLDGRDNLDETHYDSRHEADYQHRRAHP